MPDGFVRKWGPLDECGTRNLVDEKASRRGLTPVVPSRQPDRACCLALARAEQSMRSA